MIITCGHGISAYCRYESYLSRYVNFKAGRLKPYCDHIPLPFSMSSMDHLDGVQKSKNLGHMYKAELNIKDGIRHSMDNYGHFVNQAMKQVRAIVCICVFHVVDIYVVVFSCNTHVIW